MSDGGLARGDGARSAAAATRAAGYVVPVRRDGAEPDFVRDVHVSKQRSSRREQRQALRERMKHAAVRVLTVPRFFWLGVGVVVAITAGTFLMRFGLIIGIGALAVLLVVMIVPVVMWLRNRNPKKPPKGEEPVPEESPDERYRLRLIAPPAWAYEIRGLNDQPFEPRVFQVLFAVPKRKWPAVTTWVVLFVALGALWWYIKRSMGVGSMPGMHFQAWDVWASMAVASLPFAWMWPTYVRVSPGKLDIMRFGVLGAGTPTIKTIDLRDARVLCASDGVIVIEREGEAPLTIQFSEWGARWNDIFRSVFEAARWRGELLELPDDSLVG